VSAIAFENAGQARMSEVFAAALDRDDLEAVVICPSNPYHSIDPIFAVPGARAALANAPAPRIAICPLVGGDAVKGPTAKLMQELGVPTTPESIAAHYGGLIDCLVIDTADRAHVASVEATGIACAVAPTLMQSDDDKVSLARVVMESVLPRLDPRARAQ
jgi:LPPG:FO 2-phospho-L-lactate transferase